MIVTVQVKLLVDYEDHQGRKLAKGTKVRMPPGEARSLEVSKMAKIIPNTSQEHPERRSRVR